MIKVLLLLALVVPAPFASTGIATATARPSPQTMHLSSWHPVSVGGSIVGGTQSVTIVNPSTASVEDISFSLATPPCACSLVSATASDGTVDSNVWAMDTLPAGATVSLDLVYENRG